MILRIKIFLKDILFIAPITLVFQPFAKFLTFITYYNRLVLWIYSNRKQLAFNDFYSPLRKYDKRLTMYDHLLGKYQLDQQKITYLEFGVANGGSFKWWLQHNKNSASRFYGFDTFEGLPEDWGVFDKGDMAYNVPALEDARGKFYKGLFQDTLNNFLKENESHLTQDTPKIIHMDADLYSATAFALSQLYPYLKKGDLILFDEFNVAMHEFKAYDEFVKNFYIKLRPVAAVNNFYQTVFIVE
jgi:O-methyltransferase